jgi:isocitrate dehydrogenase
MSPVNAIRATLKRVRDGVDTISVTGNVLRDYLTDLFPILELGTSAKMLSIVPLLAGGGPVRDGRRWLGAEARAAVPAGELLTLGLARRVPGPCRVDRGLRHEGPATPGRSSWPKRSTLAVGRFLESDKSPSRAVGGIDNRGSHFYLAMYWARALATRRRTMAQGEVRANVADALEENERRSSPSSRRPGQARRDRRLLPSRPEALRGRDAAERHAERDHRRMLTCRRSPWRPRVRAEVWN